ncbi:MAG: hypothetical protein ABI467_15610 [Kofleriaceae bacterium]
MSRIAMPATFAGVLAALATAHADPIADFQLGKTLYLRSATSTVAGYTSGTGGVEIGKTAHTLSFAVDGATLGAPGVIVNLAGSVDTSDPTIHNRLKFTFSENYGAGVPVDGVTLYTASGTIYAFVSYIPGQTTATCKGQDCQGDVLLDVDTLHTTIHVTGDFGSDDVAIDHARLVGGMPTPHLQSFYNFGGPVCSTTTGAVTAPLTVKLRSQSPSSGTTVFLSSVYPSGVAVPFLQVVPPGKDSIVVDATIAPGFFGIVPLFAASGGSLGTTMLEVDPPHACDPPPKKKVWVDYNPDWGCIACTTFIAHDDGDDAITLVDRQQMIVAGGVKMLKPSQLVPGASSVTASALSNNGIVAGHATIDGKARSFLVNISQGVGVPQLFSNVTIAAVNQSGAFVGTHLDGDRTTAFYSQGTTATSIKFDDAISSAATGISDSGEVVGTYTTSAHVTRGFRFRGDRVLDLPVVSSTMPTIPVAQSDGTILATVTSSKGATTTLVISDANTATRLLAPSGYTNFVGRSINRAGRIVGTAMSTTGLARAFVWNPTTGFIPLTGYIRGMSATDALSITDTDQVVVQGTIDGRSDLYLVSL